MNKSHRTQSHNDILSWRKTADSKALRRNGVAKGKQTRNNQKVFGFLLLQSDSASKITMLKTGCEITSIFKTK